MIDRVLSEHIQEFGPLQMALMKAAYDMAVRRAGKTGPEDRLAIASHVVVSAMHDGSLSADKLAEHALASQLRSARPARNQHDGARSPR